MIPSRRSPRFTPPSSRPDATSSTAGFIEEPVPGDPGVPDELDRELFRADAHLRPALSGAGLQILGGPRGEGQALLIARRVRAALAAGVDPDDVLILVPREDDDVATIRATLATWGIPVAPGPTRRLATFPAVAALRLALRLPVEGWEVATLARLLRNGAIAWSRLDLGDPYRRFEVAAAVCATRVLSRSRQAPQGPRPRDRREPSSRSRPGPSR